MNWVLEGIFDSDKSLGVRTMEVYHDQNGGQLAYYLLNIEIDNDPGLWRVLNEIVQGPVRYFDRLILVEQPNAMAPHEIHRHVYTFRKPWLYSFERNFNGSRYTARAWKKPVLSIAFDKSALNNAAIGDLVRSGVH